MHTLCLRCTRKDVWLGYKRRKDIEPSRQLVEDDVGSHLCNSINAELNSVDDAEAVKLSPGENDTSRLLCMTLIAIAQDNSLPISPVSHTIQGDGQLLHTHRSDHF